MGEVLAERVLRAVKVALLEAGHVLEGGDEIVLLHHALPWHVTGAVRDARDAGGAGQGFLAERSEEGTAE